MSRYAGLLGDAAKAGLYRLPAQDLQELGAAAQSIGMAVRSVDLAGVRDKAGFLRALARALDFPDWFGQNWDALEDCLTDLSWLEAGGWLLILRHADPFRTRGEEFATAAAVLADASAYWREQGIPFWCLVETALPGLPEIP